MYFEVNYKIKQWLLKITKIEKYKIHYLWNSREK